MNYQDANARLTGRCQLSRKLANNTYLMRHADNQIIVKLHNTAIIVMSPDGKQTLNTGGWHTSTTKDRLNRFANFVDGYGIVQDKAVWYIIKGYNTKAGRFLFIDGMQLDKFGCILNAKIETKEDKRTTNALKRKLNAFAALFANSLPLPKPSSGDCLICQTETNIIDHIESHIEESYLVPRLLYNALKRFGASPVMWTAAFSVEDGAENYRQGFVKEQIQKAVFRYLKEQFGLAS